MHTTGLRSEDFAITIGGATATIDDVFPRFDEHDRLGIVIADDFGAAGAGSLILAAVTASYDRGVTRLLVPHRQPAAPELAAETRHSAQRLIRTALIYSPSGQPPHADVVVRGSAQSDAFIDAMLGGRGTASRVQSFRRLSIDEVLGLLPTARG